MVMSSSLTTLPGTNFLPGLRSKPLTFKAFSGLAFLPRSSEGAELSFGDDSTLSGVFLESSVFSWTTGDDGFFLGDPDFGESPVVTAADVGRVDLGGEEALIVSED